MRKNFFHLPSAQPNCLIMISLSTTISHLHDTISFRLMKELKVFVEIHPMCAHQEDDRQPLVYVRPTVYGRKQHPRVGTDLASFVPIQDHKNDVQARSLHH